MRRSCRQIGRQSRNHIFRNLHLTSALLHTGHSPRAKTVKQAMTQDSPDYKSWTNDRLVDRIVELEQKLRDLTHSAPNPVDDPPALNDGNSSSDLTTPTQEEQLPYQRPRKTPKEFDPTRYHTRLVALKFAYLGAEYNGFEHHVGNSTPLPTIEEEIWKALVKTRLIFPRSNDSLQTSITAVGGSEKQENEKRRFKALDAGHVPVNWDDCEYSKCGRTDRGVSAFGQVIGVRVRSARVKERKRPKNVQKDDSASGATIEMAEDQTPVKVAKDSESNQMEDPISQQSPDEEEQEATFDPIQDELPYVSLLNKVLPPTIRILAWCPSVPSNFSARFSCKERLYRYFFTNPAYLPAPLPSKVGNGAEQGQLKDGWLDIAAMEEAAGYLEGLNDYRNLCKVDPTKQLTNFKRRISHASIDVVSAEGLPAGLLSQFTPSEGSSTHELGSKNRTGIYAFTVRGSAFLWHQVRCMVAILFLVGQGLEKPTIVKELLDVKTNPCKPRYEMASDAPLILWDCTFSKSAGIDYDGEAAEQTWDRGLGPDELEWVYAGEEGPVQSSGKKDPSAAASLATWRKYDRSGIAEDAWKGWRTAKMNEILSAQLLDLVAGQGPQVKNLDGEVPGIAAKIREAKANVRVFQGEEYAPSRGKYVPLMKRERNETVEVINARYLMRKPEKAKYFPKNTKPAEVAQS